jgi:acyl carrier protein
MRLTREQIREILIDEVSQETKQDLADIRPDIDFVALGLDSLSCIYVLHQVEKRIHLPLNPSMFWDYPTINSLSEHLFDFQHEHG